MNYILKCSIFLLIGIIIYLLINNNLKVMEGFGPEGGPFFSDNIETITFIKNLDGSSYSVTFYKIQLDDQTRYTLESNSVTSDNIFYIGNNYNYDNISYYYQAFDTDYNDNKMIIFSVIDSSGNKHLAVKADGEVGMMNLNIIANIVETDNTSGTFEFEVHQPVRGADRGGSFDYNEEGGILQPYLINYRITYNVDCEGSWSDWSECSALCGGGTQRRNYTVTTPASSGGTACPTSPEIRTCNTYLCPEKNLELLLNIAKDRDDSGCHNYRCKEDPYNINLYSIWENKIEYTDENQYLCNNSDPNSVVSQMNTGNRCNNDLCCDDNSCENKFFSRGHSCIDRIRYPGLRCPAGTEGIDCFNYCCGSQITGPSQVIFNNIKEFRKQIRQNTINLRQDDTGCLAGTDVPDMFNRIIDRNIVDPDNIHDIFGIDYRNFIYFNLIDLEHLANSIPNINTSLDNLTYYDFECISNYLKTLYVQLNTNDDPKNLDLSILNNDASLKLKDNVVDDEMNVTEFVDQLVDQTKTGSILSERLIGSTYTKEMIHDNYLNFLRKYTNLDDTNNTNEDLIKDLKLSIIMLDETVEGDDTPLDLMFGTRSGGYKDTVINNVNFEVLL